MDLKQLECFVQVVEAGSFSRAAARLHASQPTLSRRIALLEASIGQPLLVRTGRGVEPTEAGRALHGHARALLELAGRAQDELRDLQASPRGRVVVGLPPRIAQAMAAELVARFRARFPHAVITVVEGLSMALREWLVAGRVDLALLFDPPPAPQLFFETLKRESLILVGPANGPRLPARIGLAALAAHALVLPAAPNALRTLVDEALRPRGITLKLAAEVDSVHTVLSLVARGVGCAVLPESAADGPSFVRGMQVARIGPPAIRNRLVLAIPRARPATRLMRETAGLLKELDFRSLNRSAARK